MEKFFDNIFNKALKKQEDQRLVNELLDISVKANLIAHRFGKLLDE